MNPFSSDESIICLSARRLYMVLLKTKPVLRSKEKSPFLVSFPSLTL